MKKKDFVREEKIAEEDVKAKEAAAKAEAKAKQVRSESLPRSSCMFVNPLCKVVYLKRRCTVVAFQDEIDEAKKAEALAEAKAKEEAAGT